LEKPALQGLPVQGAVYVNSFRFVKEALLNMAITVSRVVTEKIQVLLHVQAVRGNAPNLVLDQTSIQDSVWVLVSVILDLYKDLFVLYLLVEILERISQ